MKKVTNHEISLKKQLIKNVLLLVSKVLVIIIIFYFIFFHLFGVTRVKDELMTPNIRDGDFLIFYRLDKNYQVGESIVAKIDNQLRVFRIVGLPGDKIEFDEDLDRILINGAPEEHITYFKTVLDNDSSIAYPYVVPKDSYFLANDYRMNFSDSRTFGAVSKNQILGKVIGKLQSRNI